MNRRSVLGAVASGGASLLAGCWGASGNGGGCPNPELDAELTFEVRTPGGSSQPGKVIDIVTETSEIDDFDIGGLTDGDTQWIEETDFEEAVIVGILETAGGGGGNSGIEVLGVDRESEDTLHVYSCIADTGGGDAALIFRRILRVFYDGQLPEHAKHTHWQKGESSTYDTNQ